MRRLNPDLIGQDSLLNFGGVGSSPVTLRPGRPSGLFSFPDPVNEVSARLVAGAVVVMSLVAIGFDQPWLTAVIAYGFLARVLTGPSLSPLGQLVTRVITPRLGARPKPVAGPPKRFAQGIGATMSVAAAILALGFGLRGVAYVLLGLVVVAAGLESIFAYCVGCKIFGLLMRAGIVPEEVCERCSDIWSGPGTSAAGSPGSFPREAGST